ncbi:phosphoglycerate mutase [Clostridium sulfidigenes]|uniref:Phosphoglycerate mutase n=1 Tax=Clostridium sulfidigenes TaxID=318464 RepID=A0A084JEK0_9CLOT|nr:histidine phosphatase family protein [Clostridium sulfidigenes]KEZ87384.1 phosphoglycerate mutase [Clostridium sulfidigenes]
MKRIITIQHTQSVHHTNGMIGSWTDWDLTNLGKEQANNIGIKLKEELSKDIVYVMYSSDLKRAKQTAEIVAKHLNLEPVINEDLRERNLGSAVGKSVQWLRENQTAWEKTIDDRCVPDAESRRETWKRLEPFYNDIMSSEDENIIIVSHGDTLSIFNAMWLGLKPDDLNNCDLFGFAGGVSHFIEDDNGKHIIKRLSDMSYIK